MSLTWVYPSDSGFTLSRLKRVSMFPLCCSSPDPLALVGYHRLPWRARVGNQRKNLILTPRACQHRSSRFHRLALITTAMFLLWWLLTSTGTSSGMCPGKGGQNCRLNFCPHLTDLIKNRTWKRTPPLLRSSYMQKQQLSFMHGNQHVYYWISKPTMVHP